jgi:hypothetical protein
MKFLEAQNARNLFNWHGNWYILEKVFGALCHHDFYAEKRNGMQQCSVENLGNTAFK